MRFFFTSMFLFLFVTGCNNNISNPSVADQDIVDVVQLSLANALVNHDIPDYGLIADPQNVILADTLIAPGMVPALDGIKITVMSTSQIKQKADADSSFVYLRFLSVEKDSLDRIVVCLATTWAVSKKDADLLYLSGGFNTYRFTKTNGVWEKELLSVAIS